MNVLEATARWIPRAASSFAFLSILVARLAGGAPVQVEAAGTVDFVGCPSAISCPSYPLMWGVSGGESMTLRMFYDPAIPVAEDLSDPEAFLVRYEHALPLQPPLGVEVVFGPYVANVGSAGVAPEMYRITVFDVILPYPNYPDISEVITVATSVAPLTLTLPGPSGYHDLDLRGISFGFRNFYGEDFLNGPEIPPAFPGFNWEELMLTVDVYDPVYDRDGTAFLKVENLTVTPAPSVPSLSTWGLLLLAGGLLALAWPLLAGIRASKT